MNPRQGAAQAGRARTACSPTRASRRCARGCPGERAPVPCGLRPRSLRRNGEVVELRRVLGEDSALLLVAQVVTLRDDLHAVRERAVPVAVVGRITDDLVTERLAHD